MKKTVLNVGGGSKAIPIPDHYKGWKHDLLDIDPAANPDILLDARLLKEDKAQLYDAIFCSHNLEHYHRHDAIKVVQGFNHVLTDDGFAEIYVPDIASVMQHADKNNLDLDDELYVSSAGPILVRDVLYGFSKQIESSGQDYFAHKTGFTSKSLIKLMADNGFFHHIANHRGDFEIGGYFFKKEPLAELVKSLSIQPIVPTTKAKKSDRMKIIAIGIPTLGVVSVEFMQAYADILWPMNTGKVTFIVKDLVGGEIAETRNRIVHQALSYENSEREITHILWLDDDVIFTRLVLQCLLDMRAEIASGVYFTKGEFSEPLIMPSRVGGTTRFMPDKRFETWGHGMGLCLVQMDVYRRMVHELKLPPDKYGRPQWYRTTANELPTVEKGMLNCGGTEDTYFLDMANKLGIVPGIDTSRFAFGWHFDKTTGTGYPKKQWNQYIRRQPIEWDTEEGKKVWELSNGGN